MNYFNYTTNLEVWKIQMIKDVVFSLEPYAKSIYKSVWQDAIDAAFFHILKHFDFSLTPEEIESGEDLEEKLSRYSTKVVGTILLNKYNHEIEHEISLINGIDRDSIHAEKHTNPLFIILSNEEEQNSQDVQSCIKYLVPYFIRDYKLFKTMKPDRRHLSYKELFDNFTYSTIIQSIEYLNNNYSDTMDRVYDLISNSRYRMFSTDRYKKNLDSSIRYRGYINNTLIYQSVSKVKGNKSFFYFDLEGIIDDIIYEYYSEPDVNGYFTVENTSGYISLSGVIVFSIEELRESLEYELIGTVLARMSHLKVVVYQKGKYLILSSPRGEECGLLCSIYDTNYRIGFRKLVSKRIQSPEEACKVANR